MKIILTEKTQQELESIYNQKPRQLMFGSNENLILVVTGHWP